MLIRLRRMRSEEERRGIFVHTGDWPPLCEELNLVTSMLAENTRARLASNPEFLAMLDKPGVKRITIDLGGSYLPELEDIPSPIEYSLFAE